MSNLLSDPSYPAYHFYDKLTPPGKMLKKITILVCLTVLAHFGVMCQSSNVVIVVIGSSTAEGTGAWPMDSSWVGRVAAATKRDLTDNADTTVLNLAKGGTTTYVGRENGFVAPIGYAGPDPDRNISKALALDPDIIIVNYPSNDVANNMSTATTMANYAKYQELASAAGVKLYFLTSQPRNTVSYDQKVQLKEQKDVILNAYPATAINVWDFLVDSDGLSIHPLVSAGDGTHINNDGHRYVFQAVAAMVAPSILPVRLSRFTADPTDKKVSLFWETLSESKNSHFVVERSSNGTEFRSIAEVKGKGNRTTRTSYNYTDHNPEKGKNFYRLKQVDLDGKFSYSQVIRVSLKPEQQTTLLYPVPATNQINLKITSEKKETLQISIYDRLGNIWATYHDQVVRGDNTFRFPISKLPTGNYFMQIKSPAATFKRSFVKL